MGREVDRFVAHADDGREVTIIVEEDVVDASSHDDPHATIGGLREAHTEHGERVERVDDQAWRVPSIGIVHRRH